MKPVPRDQWKTKRSEAAAANDARRVQMLEHDLVTDTFDDAKNAIASAGLLAAIRIHHESDPHAA